MSGRAQISTVIHNKIESQLSLSKIILIVLIATTASVDSTRFFTVFQDVETTNQWFCGYDEYLS